MEILMKSKVARKKAENQLNQIESLDELEHWWENYSPLGNQYIEKIVQVIQTRYDQGEKEEKKYAIACDEKMADRRVARSIKSKFPFALTSLPLEEYDRYAACEEDLEIVDPVLYKKMRERWKTLYKREAFEKEEPILLEPAWSKRVHNLADQIGIPWKVVLKEFEDIFSKKVRELNEDELNRSEEFASHLDPDIQKIMIDLCQKRRKEIDRQKREELEREVKRRKLDEQQEVEIQKVNRQKTLEATKKETKETKQKNKMLDLISAVTFSAYMMAASMIVFEGMIKSKKYFVTAPFIIWIGIMILSIGMIGILLKFKKYPKQYIYLYIFFGAIFWVSCIAVIKVVFGTLYELIFLGVLFIIMAALFLLSRRD
jgi:hypothetical protein